MRHGFIQKSPARPAFVLMSRTGLAEKPVASRFTMRSELRVKTWKNEKTVWEENYRFFGAPVGLIFYIEDYLETGSWMDLGMFIQNVMLAARAFGLETCPQAALAEYPDIVREHLGIEKKYHIACGMSLGYPDLSAAINSYRTEREPIAELVRYSR